MSSHLLLDRTINQQSEATQNVDSIAVMAERVIFVGHEKDPSLIIDECAIPDITDGQILARIRLATICGSDLHTIQGKRVEATPRYVRVSLHKYILIG